MTDFQAPQPEAAPMPDNPLAGAVCSVAEARGYVAFGAGVYRVCQTVEPGLVVTFRRPGEEDRAVSERAEAPDLTPIPPEDMIVRLQFTSAAGLDSLEDHLREIRAEHWPETVGGQSAKQWLDQRKGAASKEWMAGWDACRAAGQAFPAPEGAQATPSSHWAAAGEPDPHGDRYDCERAALVLGNLTDDELANGAFMNYNAPLNIAAVMNKVEGYHPPIAWMTAVKDRIRWLSRALERTKAAQAQSSPAEAHGLDQMRRDLIADTRETFDASGSETPQSVRDVIEYVDSWLQVQVGRAADRAKPQPKGTEADTVQVPRQFLTRFYDLAHNYSLRAVAPDYYQGTERDAFEFAYARCGSDLIELRKLLTAQAPAPAPKMTDEQAEKLLKDFAIAVMFGSLEDRVAKAAPIKAALTAQPAQAPAVGDAE